MSFQSPFSSLERRLFPRAAAPSVASRGFSILLLVLGGCQSYGGMSASEIKEAAKDAAAVCVRAPTSAGMMTIVVVHGNNPMPPGVEIKAETCDTKITTPSVTVVPPSCAKQSYERQPDGTCLFVTRDEACRVRASAMVDSGKCP